MSWEETTRQKMLHLKLPTDPRWVDIAQMQTEDILVDHAYCEQKAASSCISLIVRYNDLDYLVETLTPIVAEAYNPSYQQFHLQNTFDVYAYPVLDFFLDFRINRTRVLLKYNHLNAGLLSREGYFVTPDYTGYRSFLDLGISWYLFD